MRPKLTLVSRPAHLFAGLFTLAAAVGFQQASGAATLVSYTFSDGTGAATIAPGEAVHAEAAVWSASGGFSSGSGTAYVTSNNTPDAFDAGFYLSVTISAESGHVLNLDSVSFDLGGNATSTGISNLLSAEVRSDRETSPFSTSLVLEGGGTVASHTVANTDSVSRFTSFTVDLSGIAFQGQSGVTLNFYLYDTANIGAHYVRLDNIVINGSSVAVPEAGATALLLAGAATLALLVRASRK